MWSFHFQRSPLWPSHHHRARAFLSIRQQFRPYFIGVRPGANELLSVIFPIPGELDGQLGPFSSTVGRDGKLDRLPVSQKPKRCLRGGADEGGDLKNGRPIQFFWNLNGDSKLKWAVAWRIRRWRDVQVDNLQFRLRARNPRRLRFRHTLDGENGCETEADTKKSEQQSAVSHAGVHT